MALDLVGTPEALRPYDKDGIHYVPKIHIENLVVKSKLTRIANVQNRPLAYICNAGNV